MKTSYARAIWSNESGFSHTRQASATVLQFHFFKTLIIDTLPHDGIRSPSDVSLQGYRNHLIGQ